MESEDLTYILETEKHFLDIISDCYIGEGDFDSMAAIQNECMNRLRKRYTDFEIEELKNRLPKNFESPVKSMELIHSEHLEFTKSVFVPTAIEVRSQLVKYLPEKVRHNIKELMSTLKSDLDLHYSNLRIKIERSKEISESQKVVELKQIRKREEYSRVIPNLAEVWRPANPKTMQIKEAAESLLQHFAPYETELDELYKKRYRIVLGRIGNFLMMGFKINTKEEFRVHSIQELLIMESNLETSGL